MIAISTDKLETQARWKKSLGAPYPFIADKGGELTKLYGVKTPLLTFAKRTTFCVGQDGKIVSIDTGRAALDPSKAMAACSIGGG